MNRTRRANADAGNAVSLEDALSIMVVMFVLFFLFLVPLVNMDIARLELAQKDTYWVELAQWIEKHPGTPDKAISYVNNFGLKNQKIVVSDLGDKKYIESLSDKGDLTVIMHNGSKYISLMVKGYSSVVTYRYGNISWSEREREWFAFNSHIDYGENEFTREMQEEYRLWTKKQRGF